MNEWDEKRGKEAARAISPRSGAPSAEQEARRGAQTKNESHDTWRDVLSGVTPLKGEKKIVPPSSTPAPRRPHVNSALPMLAPSAAPPGRIERNLLDRIAKGKEPIDARIDLHGLAEAEAHRRLVAFVQRCYASGERTLLVITGKGRGGEGVLRRALPHWLETEELSGYIGGYHSARISHGGEGAWYLRLRRRKEPTDDRR